MTNQPETIENASHADPLPNGLADADRQAPNETVEATAEAQTVPLRRRPVLSGWRRILYLTFAGVFFVFGVLGALLPGLPATPFLLLTSYLLVRTSPRLNAALLNSRFFGPILVDWQEHGGVRRDVKLQAIVVVVIAVTATIVLSGYSLMISVAVVLLAMAGISVILRLPTARTK